MLDINVIRGVVLIILMAAFIGLWIWAWSDKRKTEFDAAAQLPLEERGGDPRQGQEGTSGE